MIFPNRFRLERGSKLFLATPSLVKIVLDANLSGVHAQQIFYYSPTDYNYTNYWRPLKGVSLFYDIIRSGYHYSTIYFSNHVSI